MNLNVNYLGLQLSSPVVVASSPFTSDVDKIVSLAEHGAGAVVLKSVFEEQILGESSFLERFNDYPEASDYLRGYMQDDYLKHHLQIISEAKRKAGIPIIASINCNTVGNWVEYASAIETAGADALELNIFILPTDIKHTGAEIEKHYLEIVARVTAVLKIPVSVKLGMRFTNVLDIARGIYYRNGRGVVMFNRFFEPDVDVESMTLKSSDTISANSELRNILRTVALCAPQLPLLDIAVSTGVHAGEDVVKALLVGAKATEICSAIYLKDVSVIRDMNQYLADWMVRHNYNSIDEFRGKLAYAGQEDDEMFQRAQYMRYFPRS